MFQILLVVCTSHVLWVVRTSHVLWVVQTSYVLWVVQTSHVLWVVQTSHVLWVVQTSHVLWVVQTSHVLCVVKVRSYIEWYPVRMTGQSALHFNPWQTCSFQGHIYFSGKHSATLQLREDYSFTFPPLSVLRYIQLSELWQHGVIKLAKGSK